MDADRLNKLVTNSKQFGDTRENFTLYLLPSPGQRGRWDAPYPITTEEVHVKSRALRIISGLGGTAALVALTPSIGFAEELTPDDVQLVLNNIWVFIAGILVFFMQAGFALLEAGLTRAKNVVNIFAKNMADAVIGILAFFATGYAFAFGSVAASGLEVETFSSAATTITPPSMAA